MQSIPTHVEMVIESIALSYQAVSDRSVQGTETDICARKRVYCDTCSLEVRDVCQIEELG